MIPRPRRTLRARAVALGLALLAGLGCASTGRVGRLPQAAPVARSLVVVSVPGLGPERLSAMPALSALAEAGALAERVEGVTPASTHPAHATLVTGAAPLDHGIVADQRLGDRGVRAASYDHASLLRTDTLWQRVAEQGAPVASLDWPTTLGAAIPLLVPHLGPPGPRDEALSWSARLQTELEPEMAERVRRQGGDGRETGSEGPERDAVIGKLACELLAEPEPPRLLLLRFAQTAPALRRHGPASEEARRAFERVDGELWDLLLCLEWTGGLRETAIAVVGDHGLAEVHTRISPNVPLAREGLLEPLARGVAGWKAIARSNGGSAFVYARSEDAAIRARVSLGAVATRSGAFRVVPAEEMIRLEADPQAWFGLEAEPGYVFADDATGELLAPAAERGAGGYLASREAMDTSFVVWGAGVRRDLQIPEMRLADVAPTLARLLRVPLDAVGGRALVGLLTPESAGAAAPGPSDAPEAP